MTGAWQAGSGGLFPSFFIADGFVFFESLCWMQLCVVLFGIIIRHGSFVRLFYYLVLSVQLTEACYNQRCIELRWISDSSSPYIYRAQKYKQAYSQLRADGKELPPYANIKGKKKKKTHAKQASEF